jgi:hypothetical protein
MARADMEECADAAGHEAAEDDSHTWNSDDSVGSEEEEDDDDDDDDDGHMSHADGEYDSDEYALLTPSLAAGAGDGSGDTCLKLSMSDVVPVLVPGLDGRINRLSRLSHTTKLEILLRSLLPLLPCA